MFMPILDFEKYISSKFMFNLNSKIFKNILYLNAISNM